MPLLQAFGLLGQGVFRLLEGLKTLTHLGLTFFEMGGLLVELLFTGGQPSTRGVGFLQAGGQGPLACLNVVDAVLQLGELLLHLGSLPVDLGAGLVQLFVLTGEAGALLLAFELQGGPVRFDGGLLGLEGLAQLAQFLALFGQLPALLFQFTLACVKLLRAGRQLLVSGRVLLRHLGAAGPFGVQLAVAGFDLPLAGGQLAFTGTGGLQPLLDRLVRLGERLGGLVQIFLASPSVLAGLVQLGSPRLKLSQFGVELLSILAELIALLAGRLLDGSLALGEFLFLPGEGGLSLVEGFAGGAEFRLTPVGLRDALLERAFAGLQCGLGFLEVFLPLADPADLLVQGLFLRRELLLFDFQFLAARIQLI